jgi:hypothetical protein
LPKTSIGLSLHMSKPTNVFYHLYFPEIILIFVTSLLFVLPVLYQTRNMSFRLFSDYDSMLPMYDFVASYIRDYHIIPSWNPFIGFGIPVIGDPLSGILNPFIIIPFIFWGTSLGTKFLFWEIVFLSGISMWWLIKSLSGSKWVRVWAGCLYAVSGGLIGKFGAGHVEQFFAYPLIPLIFVYSLKKKLRLADVILLGFFMAGLYYSGSIYHLFYMLILVSAIRLYYLVILKNNFKYQIVTYVGIMITIFIVSFPKLFDYYYHVIPLMRRFITDPTRGSLSLPFFLLPFMMPFSVSFYGRPKLQNLIGIYYNWYEYYSFIAPFPILVVWKFKLLWRDERIKILSMVLAVGALFVACRYWYSPFYWIYKYVSIFQIFRTPQRMYLPISTVMIAFMAISVDLVIKKLPDKIKFVTGLCGASFLVTFIVTQYLFSIEAFEIKVNEAENVVLKLREYDRGRYYVASFLPRTQGYLIKSKIPIINYYYGWTNKHSPIYSTDDNQLHLDQFDIYRPKYIIANINENRFKVVGYYQLFIVGNSRVWQTDAPNIFP